MGICPPKVHLNFSPSVIHLLTDVISKFVIFHHRLKQNSKLQIYVTILLRPPCLHSFIARYTYILYHMTAYQMLEIAYTENIVSFVI